MKRNQKEVICKNEVKMHHQKNSRKKVRVLSSSNESSDSTNLQKHPKKKRIVALISSDESDTAIKDDDLNRQKSFKHFDPYPKVVHHDSDNSSVESMDKIMYPSTSVLLEIENSKKTYKNAETKDHDKKNLKGRSKNCSVKDIKKSKVSKRQPNIEKTFNKSSKEFSKKKEISTQHKHTKEIHSKVKNKNENLTIHRMNSKNVPDHKVFNHHGPKKKLQNNKNSKNVPEGKISNHHQSKKEVQNNVTITEVKNKNDSCIIHSIKNKNALHQNLASNEEKFANYKIPRLPPSNSDKNEKSMPNKCNENDKATCSNFQNEKSEFQIKQSTVKKRPLNYGSRMKPFLSDLESSLENKSLLSKHKNLTEIKNINQLKVKGNEHEKRSDEKEMGYQVATDHLGTSNEIIQCTIQQDSIVRNVNQSFTESQPCNSVRMYPSLIGDDYQLKLIKRIVDIDTKSLEEREKNSSPPPNLLEGAELLPLSFKSFDRYFCKHEPMIILEIWEKIFECYKTNLSLTNNNYFSFLVKDYKYLNGLMLLDCESEVNEHRSCILAKNNLVIVKLKHKNYLTTFGFIYELENTKNIDFYKESEFPYSQNYRKAPTKQLFKMFTKSQEMVALKCFMEGKVLCNLFKEMKEMEGLYLMKSSPLMHDILNPQWDTFCTPYNKELCMKDFDTVRLHISDIVCNEIHSFPSQPKIMLLEGPPGSCKTMCIANIAWRLSRCKDNKKILIVAPNRLVLEEITAQLFDLNNMFNNDYIKCFHLGMVEITPISETMIKEASIILTRPRDCCELEPFKNVLQFSCCLVDEVNQFTEPGILYPFSLDIKKFLLVGDKNELPPKLRSNITIDFGYQKSIMERFQDFFSKTYHKNPTIVLKQQFRMHHQIALFPFKNIYSNPSIKCTYASKRSAFHPLRRYVLFDYQWDLGTKELPHTEMMGIKFITSLLTHIIPKLNSHIIPKLNSSAIGIIVPSKEVKEAYQSVIKDLPDVEIGTVEFFQGKEKPVIIISCFHDFRKDIPFNTNYFSDKRRLNVALTRAISSLIICGPFHPLMKYDIWGAIVSYSQERRDYYKIRSEKDLRNSNIAKILTR